MTIRIVVEPDEKQATCPECKAVLAFTMFDTEMSFSVSGDLGYFLDCPACEHRFMVQKGI